VALLLSSSGQAQVKAGNFRLFIDTDLVNYERTTADRPNFRDIETQVDIGPGGSALGATLPGYVGLGAGYVLSRRAVLSLHASFAHHEAVHERFDEVPLPNLDEPTVTSYMLRPELEIPFNPKSRTVLAVLVGFDLRQFHIQDGKDTSRLTGFGPTLGLIAHLFAVPYGSIDVGALTILDFLYGEGDARDSVFTETTASYRKVALSLVLGLSLWP
jgi:hypothetical protein